MKKNSIWFLGCCVSMLVLQCQQSKPVSLTVDFRSQDIWEYQFSCTIGGTFSFNDSTSTLSSTVSCLLVGKGTEHNNQLHIQTDSVVIASNTLDEDEIQHMTNQIATAEYTIALSPDQSKHLDSLLAPFVGTRMDMDIYRQLLKVLPSLPDKPVKPGFSWERERQFPVKTSQGYVTCDLYQSFTFDSIRTDAGNHKDAYISWRFRYMVDENQLDTNSLIGSLPLAGSGSGAAVLDVTAQTLAGATMVFATPVCSLGQVTVGWEEKASLQLVSRSSASGKDK